MKRASDDPASDAHKKPKTADSEDEDEQLQALAADLRRRMPDVEAAVLASSHMRDGFKIACKEMAKWKLVAENAELRAKVAELEAKVELPHGKGKLKLVTPLVPGHAADCSFKYDGEWCGEPTVADHEDFHARYRRVPHGKGKRTWSNGTVEAGTFKHFNFVKGCKYYKNGTVKQGTFDEVHGKLVGQGMLITSTAAKSYAGNYVPSETVCEGTFECGRFVRGTKTHQPVTVYTGPCICDEGTFADGVLVEGKSTVKHDGGVFETMEGTFEDGRLVRGTKTQYCGGEVGEILQTTFTMEGTFEDGRLVRGTKTQHSGGESGGEIGEVLQQGTFEGGRLVDGTHVTFRPHGEQTVEIVV